MKLRLLLPLLGALSLASCATYRLQSVSQPNPEPQGLTVEATALLGGDIQFDVKFTNKSGKTVVLDARQFKLFAGEPDRWHAAVLYSANEYYQMAEAYETQRPTISFTSESAPVRRTTIISSGNGQTVIVTRNQPVQTQTLTVVPQRDETRLAWLKAHLMDIVQLETGLDYSGVLYGEQERSSFYKLVMPIDGRTYEVVFERVKTKGKSPFMNLN